MSEGKKIKGVEHVTHSTSTIFPWPVVIIPHTSKLGHREEDLTPTKNGFWNKKDWGVNINTYALPFLYMRNMVNESGCPIGL